MPENFAFAPALVFESGDIRPSWWARWIVRRDLAAYRNPRCQLVVKVLAASPGAVTMGLNIGAIFTGYHTPVPVLLSSVTMAVLGLTLIAVLHQMNRLVSPASPATIAALRGTIAPFLWQEVAGSAANHCRFARDTPLTTALIYHWLDQAIDAARGQTAVEIVVAEQVQALG